MPTQNAAGLNRFSEISVRTFPFVAVVACGVALTLGCGGESASSKPAATVDEHHDHDHKGPHNGHVIELGQNEEYHAELVHDDATHKVTIYLLDFAVKKSVAIPDKQLTLNLTADGKPQQYQLQAVPQAEDAEGTSSRFELVDEKLLEALEAEKTTGRFNVTIAGKIYTGEISHEGHHDHKH